MVKKTDRYIGIGKYIMGNKLSCMWGRFSVNILAINFENPLYFAEQGAISQSLSVFYFISAMDVNKINLY